MHRTGIPKRAGDQTCFGIIQVKGICGLLPRTVHQWPAAEYVTFLGGLDGKESVGGTWPRPTRKVRLWTWLFRRTGIPNMRGVLPVTLVSTAQSCKAGDQRFLLIPRDPNREPRAPPCANPELRADMGQNREEDDRKTIAPSNRSLPVTSARLGGIPLSRSTKQPWRISPIAVRTTPISVFETKFRPMRLAGLAHSQSPP